jgi:hypothetical protein
VEKQVLGYCLPLFFDAKEIHTEPAIPSAA